MTITQHKTLSGALAALSAVLLIALFVTVHRGSRYRVDVRYAHDIVGRFEYQRDLALRGDVSEAAQYLEQLHFPEGQPSPFTGSLAAFVEMQRRRAIHDVVVYLRAKTGRDLDDQPEKWIREYGGR